MVTECDVVALSEEVRLPLVVLVRVIVVDTGVVLVGVMLPDNVAELAFESVALRSLVRLPRDVVTLLEGDREFDALALVDLDALKVVDSVKLQVEELD